MGKLDSLVAVITGGASGIGAATARLFAQEGAKIALVDNNIELLNETASQIRSAGGVVDTYPVDVTEGGRVAAAVLQIIAKWKRIDVLMPCSGISVGGTVATIDEALWNRVFDVNVKGSYFWMHYTLPHMIQAKRGSIVLLGSQLVVSSGGNNAAYIASKGAITALAKTMAVDHAPHGIRVNVLMPGVIDTPMSRNSLTRYEDAAATKDKWANRHAMRRFGLPEEVAKAALFLASDDSSFTTGSQLFCDGGWTVM